MKVPHYSRYRFISVICALVGISIIFQMVRIQNSPSAKELVDIGQGYLGQYETIYPERGVIFDRWGHMLAGNVETYEVGVELQWVRNDDDAKAIATVTNTVLGIDYGDALTKAEITYVEGKAIYAKLDDFVTTDQIAQLQKVKDDYSNLAKNSSKAKVVPSLHALVWTPHLNRSYPEGTLASNILGFYKYMDRTDGQGFFGVEQKYNDLLSGTPQKVWVPFDPQDVQQMAEVPPGTSLVLTIDREIQASVEKILDNAVDSTGSQSGTIIVLDPKTGELLAIATTPRLDPNKYWEYEKVFPKGTPFDRAVDTPYEPGSVFKVLTMAAAIDTGKVTPDTPFLDTGVFMIGGSPIYNWDGGAWGPQTMLGCMQHSLNVCLAWVASDLGSNNFYSYIKNFGIGRLTGIDLAGETSWPLRLPGDDQWFPVDLGTNSFGQGIAATPIEMAMAASALANDGKMMAPHVLRAMIDNGQQYNTPLQVVGSPISAETAHTMTTMLATSLEEESSVALVPGYRVAGKTGTAEIPTQFGYTSDLTNASFVGWGPVDNPQFLVYIWLEKPTASKWGSVVAAPVFSDVVKSLVVLMDIPPDDIKPQIAAQ